MSLNDEEDYVRRGYGRKRRNARNHNKNDRPLKRIKYARDEQAFAVSDEEDFLTETDNKNAHNEDVYNTENYESEDEVSSYIKYSNHDEDDYSSPETYCKKNVHNKEVINYEREDELSNSTDYSSQSSSSDHSNTSMEPGHQAEYVSGIYHRQEDEEFTSNSSEDNEFIESYRRPEPEHGDFPVDTGQGYSDDVVFNLVDDDFRRRVSPNLAQGIERKWPMLYCASPPLKRKPYVISGGSLSGRSLPPKTNLPEEEDEDDDEN